MNRVIPFSGGAASAVSAIKVVQRYGTNDIVLFFSDTKAEHPDTFRFMHDILVYLGFHDEAAFIANREMHKKRVYSCWSFGVLPRWTHTTAGCG